MDTTEITIQALLKWIVKGIAFILIFTILFGVGAFVYTKYFVPSTYQASVKFYAGGTVENKSQYMADYYRSVAPQYIEFLNVNEFYEMVANDLLEDTGISLTPAQISASFTFSTIVTDTSSFYVTVETQDPSLTYNIAMSLAEMAPKRVESFENVGSLEVLSHPIMPTAPSGPNIARNTLVGLLLGFLLSTALVVIRELSDNRLRSPEEITESFGIPLFGIVPDFNLGDKKGGSKA